MQLRGFVSHTRVVGELWSEIHVFLGEKKEKKNNYSVPNDQHYRIFLNHQQQIMLVWFLL